MKRTNRQNWKSRASEGAKRTRARNKSSLGPGTNNVVPFKRGRKSRRRPRLRVPVYIKPVLIGLPCFALLIYFSPTRFKESVAFEAAHVRVIDADTIAVGRSSIRLHGVNAPETGEKGHDEGKLFLGQLLRTTDRVSCELSKNTTYGRRIGRCFFHTSEGQVIDAQRAVIRAGFASPYFQYGGWRYVPDWLF